LPWKASSRVQQRASPSFEPARRAVFEQLAFAKRSAATTARRSHHRLRLGSLGSPRGGSSSAFATSGSSRESRSRTDATSACTSRSSTTPTCHRAARGVLNDGTAGRNRQAIHRGSGVTHVRRTKCVTHVLDRAVSSDPTLGRGARGATRPRPVRTTLCAAATRKECDARHARSGEHERASTRIEAVRPAINRPRREARDLRASYLAVNPGPARATRPHARAAPRVRALTTAPPHFTAQTCCDARPRSRAARTHR
jgi:hypothetical protein